MFTNEAIRQSNKRVLVGVNGIAYKVIPTSIACDVDKRDANQFSLSGLGSIQTRIPDGVSGYKSRV